MRSVRMTITNIRSFTVKIRWGRHRKVTQRSPAMVTPSTDLLMPPMVMKWLPWQICQVIMAMNLWSDYLDRLLVAVDVDEVITWLPWQTSWCRWWYWWADCGPCRHRSCSLCVGCTWRAGRRADPATAARPGAALALVTPQHANITVTFSSGHPTACKHHAYF